MNNIQEIELSVVIAMFNEEENVGPLLLELSRAIDTLDSKAEIIVIDDASADSTRAKLIDLCPTEPRLRVIGLKRNEGQTSAIRTGIQQAQGRIIITLDGDGQNPPDQIVKLVDEMKRSEADLVVGWRKKREDRFFAKRLPSLLGNAIIRIVTGTPVHDTGCTLKAIKSSLAQKLPLPSGMHRFMPALSRNLFLAKVVEVEVDHRPRLRGRSKYGWSRLFPVIRDVTMVGRLSFPGNVITRLTEILVTFSVCRFLLMLDPWLSVVVGILMSVTMDVICLRRLKQQKQSAIDFDSATRPVERADRP
jgi:glycosyltransferase involved in cell wall biosynthesis